MKRVLFDENVPYFLRKKLLGFEIRYTQKMGWAGIRNGNLLALAEKEGFDVLLTCDKNLRYQNKMTGKNISVLVLPSTDGLILENISGLILECLHKIQVGQVLEMPSLEQKIRFRR